MTIFLSYFSGFSPHELHSKLGSILSLIVRLIMRTIRNSGFYTFFLALVTMIINNGLKLKRRPAIQE